MNAAKKTGRDYRRNYSQDAAANLRRNGGPTYRNLGQACDCGEDHSDATEWGFKAGDTYRCDECGGDVKVG